MPDRFRELLNRRLVVPLLALLRQGVTPHELALCVALGAVIGMIPILGVSTALCALVALAWRLNMPAIQLVNYLLTPAQLLLIIPFLRIGEQLTRAPRFPISLDAGLALLSHGVFDAVRVLAVAILHATLGWLALAPPIGWTIYRLTVPLLRRFTPSHA